MTMVGTTAIEDKLQDGVPDAIANLAKVSEQSWVSLFHVYICSELFHSKVT